MAHFYYVWKDPTCEGINPQWQQMNGRKFYEFLQNEGKDRYFITMDDGADQGMDIITMETTREKYLEWDKEKARKYRLKKSQELCAPTMISMDALVGDDKELTYHDIIADDSVDVEAEVAENFMLERLREVVADLPAEDLEILDALFFNNDEELSDRQIASKKGVSKSTLNRRKIEILKKLKKVWDKIEKTVQCNGRGARKTAHSKMHFDN